MYHIMHLQSEPFSKIRNGSKEIEYRLFDAKRKKIMKGDIIIFQNIETDEQVKGRVIDIVKGHNFWELRSKLIGKAYIQFKNFQPEAMSKYYTSNQIYEFGVVGIKIKVMEESTSGDSEYMDALNDFATYICQKRLKTKTVRYSNATKARMQYKLEVFFSRNSIIYIGKYINYLEGKITRDEMKEYLPFQVSIEDISQLLNAAENLSYKQVGLTRKKKLIDYLEDDN